MAPRDEAALRALWSWGVAQGAQPVGCAPCASLPSSAGRGLVATRDLAPGQVFLRVPLRLLLGDGEEEGCGGDDDGDAAAALLRPAARLALRLLREAAAGASSRFAPYVASLPASFCDAGGWGAAAEAALTSGLGGGGAGGGGGSAWGSAAAALGLGGPASPLRAARLAAALRAHRRAHFKSACARPAHGALPARLRGWKAWRWAASCVATRTVSLPGSPAGALCPLGDMVNHACGGAAAGWGAPSPCGQFYDFATALAVPLGAELRVSYGPHCNAALALFYGFTPGRAPLSPAITSRGLGPAPDGDCDGAAHGVVNPHDGHELQRGAWLGEGDEGGPDGGGGAANAPADVGGGDGCDSDGDGAPSWVSVDASGCPSFALLCALRLRAAPRAARRARGWRAAAGSPLCGCRDGDGGGGGGGGGDGGGAGADAGCLCAHEAAAWGALRRGVRGALDAMPPPPTAAAATPDGPCDVALVRALLAERRAALQDAHAAAAAKGAAAAARAAAAAAAAAASAAAAGGAGAARLVGWAHQQRAPAARAR